MNNNILTKEIKEIIEEKLVENLYLNKKDIEFYVNFILSQPVRTVIQFLKSITESDNSMQATIYNLFIRELLDNKLNLDAIEKDYPHINTIGYEIFKLLEKTGDLETGFYCRPDGNENNINASKFYLSLVATNSINHNLIKEKDNFRNRYKMSNVIKSMLSIGASSNVYMKFVQDNTNLKEGKEYAHYIGLNKNETITSLAAHFSTLFIPDNLKKGISSGVIRTYKQSTQTFKDFIEKLGRNEKEAIPSLLSLSKKSYKGINQIVQQSILLSSNSAIRKTETRDYISIYNLMAVISEILVLDTEDNIKEDTDNISKKIGYLANIKNYQSPKFLDTSITSDEDLPLDLVTDSISKIPNDRLEIQIKKWLEDLDYEMGEINFSLLFVGKFWTRLFYTLNSISDSAKSKVEREINGKNVNDSLLLGEVYSRFILGIINSCIIEEVRYGYYEELIDKDKEIRVNIIKNTATAKNVATSSQELEVTLGNIFNSILGKEFKDESEGEVEEIKIFFKRNLPLSYTLISCPLIWTFLSTKEMDSITRKLSRIINIKMLQEEEKEDEQKEDEQINNSDIELLEVSLLPIAGLFPKAKEENKKK